MFPSGQIHYMVKAAFRELSKTDVATKIDDALNEVGEQVQGKFDYVNAKSNYKKALEAFSKQQYDKAQQYLNKALSLFPKYADAYVLKGKISAKYNKYSEAIDFYSQAIKFEENNDKAYYNRAICYNKLARAAEATLDLQKSIDLNVSNVHIARLDFDWKIYKDKIKIKYK